MESLEVSSNEELLASLAGRQAAARLIGKFGGLSSLAQASFADLEQVPGVGPSKAAAIRSAFLLAQRLVRETYPDAPVVDSPERVAGLLREEYRPMTVENFHVLCLNTRRRLIRGGNGVGPGAGNGVGPVLSTFPSVLQKPDEATRGPEALAVTQNPPTAVACADRRLSAACICFTF